MKNVLRVKGEHIHHIIPRHAGGDDSTENLVSLTVEDHAIAHFVLWKMYGRSGDLIAWKALSGDYSKDDFHREAASDRWKVDNPMFRKEVKEVFSERMTRDNPMHDPETRNKHSASMKSKERFEKLSKAKKGNTNVRGKSWFNNGVKTGMFFECPEGWTKGRLNPHWNHKRKKNVTT